jgi:hypothetical protein
VDPIGQSTTNISRFGHCRMMDMSAFSMSSIVTPRPA